MSFAGSGAHIQRPFGPLNAPSNSGYSDRRRSLACVRPREGHPSSSPSAALARQVIAGRELNLVARGAQGVGETCWRGSGAARPTSNQLR